METKRETAMSWWNQLDVIDKTMYAFTVDQFNRDWKSLTGSEIEKLWAVWADKEKPQTPTKPSGMEGEFLNTVETLAQNLKKRLLREAVKEWEQHRHNTEITPVMAQKLAADMVRKELAMEVYYSLSVKP